MVAHLDVSMDLMFSSWAGVDCYELDFNLGLGKPDAVRRPRMVPYESLLYLLHKSQQGEMAIAMCLSHDDMEPLKADERFTRYAKYVG